MGISAGRLPIAGIPFKIRGFMSRYSTLRFIVSLLLGRQVKLGAANWVLPCGACTMN